MFTLHSTLDPQQHAFMRGTDVVRIYDVDQPMGQITALLRASALLADAEGDKSVTAIINVEDHASIAAALGCSVEIMRFPITGKRPDGDPDVFLAGPRHSKKRMDEVVRMLRWQRLAPPIPANTLPTTIDDEGLADTWNFSLGETWKEITGPITQSAPARVSRGLPLASVKAQGDRPFVLACRHPNNGPVSITTLGRFNNAWGYWIPPAAITIDVGTVPEYIGIFGRYESLTVKCSEPVGHRRILAQDLAADESLDITHEVQIKDNEIIFPGKLIEKIGLSAASPGDESDPGMIVKMTNE